MKYKYNQQKGNPQRVVQKNDIFNIKSCRKVYLLLQPMQSNHYNLRRSTDTDR